jgi:uncharacterized protein
MPGRFREGFEKPVPMTPGQVTKVTFRLQDVFHTFKKWHRLQVQVHSTWFPLFDRNPQTFVENPYKAPLEAYQSQTHTIYHSAAHPSRLKVLRLPE